MVRALYLVNQYREIVQPLGPVFINSVNFCNFYVY